MRPEGISALWQCGVRQYRAWARGGLSAIGPAGTVLALLVIGAGAGGCSLSRGDGAFAKMEDNEVTGALAQADKAPTESDLAFARNAASDVLTRGGKDFSQPWENPETGARGSVTPIAAPIRPTAGPAAISWRAMSTAARKPGCRAAPANPTMAVGKFTP